MLGASCWDGPDMAVRLESRPNCCEELSKTNNKTDGTRTRTITVESMVGGGPQILISQLERLIKSFCRWITSLAPDSPS